MGHQGPLGIAGQDRQATIGGHRAGHDLLGHPPAVVAQQVDGTVDHSGRAPVVDDEAVIDRAGEEAVEVDEPVGRGPGVAVDRLVVVTDGEDLPGRTGQDPQEEEVGRGQVLELVDQ